MGKRFNPSQVPYDALQRGAERYWHCYPMFVTTVWKFFIINELWLPNSVSGTTFGDFLRPHTSYTTSLRTPPGAAVTPNCS